MITKKKFFLNIYLFLILFFIIIANISCSDSDNEIATDILQDKYNIYRVVFNNIANLKVGDKVRLDNEEIGKVKNIDLLKNQVAVLIKIRKEVPIYLNTRIENLMDTDGKSYINLKYPLVKDRTIDTNTVLFGITVSKNDFKL